MQKEGRLEVIIGVMYAGKSTELIRRYKRYINGLAEPAKIFKPSIDARYGLDDVATHDGLKIKANYVRNTDEITHLLDPRTTIIAIDEIQFFDDKIIKFCNDSAQQGKIVIAAALHKDFRDKPFPFKDPQDPLKYSQKTVYDLLPYADEIIQLNAICMHEENGTKCTRDATRTQKFIDGKIAPVDSELVKVGGKEAYKVFCREHYRFYE